MLDVTSPEVGSIIFTSTLGQLHSFDGQRAPTENPALAAYFVVFLRPRRLQQQRASSVCRLRENDFVHRSPGFERQKAVQGPEGQLAEAHQGDEEHLGDQGRHTVRVARREMLYSHAQCDGGARQGRGYSLSGEFGFVLYWSILDFIASCKGNLEVGMKLSTAEGFYDRLRWILFWCTLTSLSTQLQLQF